MYVAPDGVVYSVLLDAGHDKGVLLGAISHDEVRDVGIDLSSALELATDVEELEGALFEDEVATDEAELITDKLNDEVETTKLKDATIAEILTKLETSDGNEPEIPTEFTPSDVVELVRYTELELVTVLFGALTCTAPQIL